MVDMSSSYLIVKATPRLSKIFGKVENNSLPLKVDKQSPMTRCLRLLLGKGWGQLSLKSVEDFVSLRSSDSVKQQRIGAKLPS